MSRRRTTAPVPSPPPPPSWTPPANDRERLSRVLVCVATRAAIERLTLSEALRLAAEWIARDNETCDIHLRDAETYG